MTGSDPVPDFEWYSEKSAKLGLPPRCPFASVKRCPRYYQSLSLLGSAGSTAIDQAEDERLKSYWEGSDLWPRTGEYETSVGDFTKQDGSKTEHFSKFCPEVAYDRFGYFAAYLGDYSDEIDRDFAHKRLGEMGASADRWQWRWASIQAMHYTECPLYSPLTHGGGFLASSGPEFKFGIPGASVQFKFSWRDLRNWLVRQWMRLKGAILRGTHR